MNGVPANLVRLKVATILGTRPEIIRLSRVISVLDRDANHVLVHTGQNYDYELNQVFFQELGIRPPDYFLEVAGATAAATIAHVIARSDALLAQVKPDAVLILGDTNSALAAISAKRRQIPVFHMEAGNRCFDERTPEEINRRIVDHIGDVQLPYSDLAREHLLREGISPDRVIKTGSPMFEVFEHYRPQIEASTILARLQLEPDGYFLISSHREEIVDSPANLHRLAALLEMIHGDYGLPVLFSVHPRTRKRLEAEAVRFSPGVVPMNAFGFCDYAHLMLHARAVLSDSGSITEEASILNLRAINLRETHERAEGMEEAAVIMTGLDPRRVRQALAILESQPRGTQRLLRQVADYAMPNVSEKVLRIILSYTDYVKRVVWKHY